MEIVLFLVLFFCRILNLFILILHVCAWGLSNVHALKPTSANLLFLFAPLSLLMFPSMISCNNLYFLITWVFLLSTFYGSGFLGLYSFTSVLLPHSFKFQPDNYIFCFISICSFISILLHSPLSILLSFCPVFTPRSLNWYNLPISYDHNYLVRGD